MIPTGPAPWRTVLRATLCGANSIGNNRLTMRWWDLTLDCGHVVERPVRFPPQEGVWRRGFAAQHHPRPKSEALPAPTRVRCRLCLAEGRIP